MEMINKNKEEIEKNFKEIKDLYYDSKGCIFNDKDINEWKSPNYLILKDRLQERIKTSILWCEDEIEFLEERKKEYGDEKVFMFSDFGERLQQLKTHLKWLKEKRGQDD